MFHGYNGGNEEFIPENFQILNKPDLATNDFTKRTAPRAKTSFFEDDFEWEEARPQPSQPKHSEPRKPPKKEPKVVKIEPTPAPVATTIRIEPEEEPVRNDFEYLIDNYEADLVTNSEKSRVILQKKEAHKLDQKAREKSSKSMLEFQRLVCEWDPHTLEEQRVFNETLQALPQTFISSAQYFSSLQQFCLEEAKVVIANALNGHRRTNERLPTDTYTVRSKSCEMVQGPKRKIVSARVMLSLVDTNPAPALQYGDCVLLHGTVPTTQKFIGEKGDVLRFLGIVESTREAGMLAVRITPNSSPAKVVFAPNSPVQIRGLESMVTHQRIFSALGGMALPLGLVEEILVGTVSKATQYPAAERRALDAKVRESPFVQHLNGGQQLAVRHVLAGNDLTLIHGPPGTGKTTVLVAALRMLLQEGYRVHVASPSNIAVDEVCLKLLKVAPELKQCVCLVGVESKIDLNGDLGDIFITNKMEKARQRFCDCGTLFRAVPELLRLHHSAGVADPSASRRLENLTAYITKEFSPYVAGLRRILPKVDVDILSALKRMEEAVEILTSPTLIPTPTPAPPSSGGFDWGGNWGEGHSPTPELDLDLLISDAEAITEAVKFLLSPANEQELTVGLVDNCQLLASTLVSGGRNVITGGAGFDVVLVDEASQALEAEVHVVLRPSTRRVVLVGDPKQLPATLMSPLTQGCGYGRSMLTRLMGLGYPHVMLNLQYRMHPDISHLPSKLFYDSKLLDADIVHSAQWTQPYHQHPLFQTTMFVDVFDGCEKRVHTSFSNYPEALVIADLVRKLHVDFDVPCERISVITFYLAQFRLVKKLLLANHLPVQVRTVDAFQGRENDVVILSFTRANNLPQTRNLGFVTNQNRLNVALTRAKYCCLLVGHMKTLAFGCVDEGSLSGHISELTQTYRSFGRYVVYSSEGVGREIVR